MVFRPPFIKQLDGSPYAGVNCTLASGCMAAIRHKVGSNPPGSAMWYPKPWYLRKLTGDTSGGTNLAQLDRVLDYYYGINLETVYADSWENFHNEIRSGRGAVLQGSYSVLYNTRWSGSKTFKGNHAIYVNECRYNYTLKRWEYLVYDPLCDHRRAGLDQAPSWIPGSVLREFAGKLLVGTRRAGIGKAWASYTRDTEPAVRLAYRATKYPNGPRPFYARVDGAKIRSSAKIGNTNIITKLDEGDPFLVYQYKTGQKVSGSTRWYGNRTGTRWMHSSVLRTTRS